MTCDNCVRHVERALKGVEGVSSVDVSLQLRQATVDFDPAVASPATMATAVAKAGYTLEIVGS
jgi:copper chaperone CopZ